MTILIVKIKFQEIGQLEYKVAQEIRSLFEIVWLIILIGRDKSQNK